MTTFPADPSVQDFLAAMREMGSFVDITPTDAEELFQMAQRSAVKRLRAEVKVGRIMSAPALALAPDLALAQAAEILAVKGYSGAPVAKDGRLLGVISIKDFMAALGLPKNAHPMSLVASLLKSENCTGGDWRAKTVGDIMTAPALSVSPDTCAAAAAALMSAKGASRLPVVDGDRLAGIVTSTDLTRTLGQVLEARP